MSHYPIAAANINSSAIARQMQRDGATHARLDGTNGKTGDAALKLYAWPTRGGEGMAIATNGDPVWPHENGFAACILSMAIPYSAFPGDDDDDEDFVGENGSGEWTATGHDSTRA